MSKHVRRYCCGGPIYWLLMGAVITGCGFLPAFASVSAEEPARKVQLTIDFGDGFQKHYSQLAWREEMTVLDLLEQAAKHPRGVKLEYRGKGPTAFVTSIDGVANEGKGRNWTFRVNGQLADRGSGVYPLKPDDNVLWKFAEKQ